MEARMPHIAKPAAGGGNSAAASAGTVSFTGSTVKITHADVIADQASPIDPKSSSLQAIGIPNPDDLPPIEWPETKDDSGADVKISRDNFAKAKEVSMKQVHHDMDLLMTSVDASAKQVARAHTALTQQAQHHLNISAQRTAEYMEVMLQGSSFAEFQANEATRVAGQLASQLMETSEQMNKSQQILVDIARTHAVLDELDVLMDDMERAEEQERLTKEYQQQQNQQQQQGLVSSTSGGTAATAAAPVASQETAPSATNIQNSRGVTPRDPAGGGGIGHTSSTTIGDTFPATGETATGGGGHGTKQQDGQEGAAAAEGDEEEEPVDDPYF